MYDLLYELSPYAPFVLFVATTLDIFFVSGYIFYGAAMMSSVAVMHATGIVSAPMIILAAYAGTLLGTVLNFYAGRLLGETQIVKRRLQGPSAAKAQAMLRSRGLFLFMAIGRSITFTRPIYALILGTLDIRFRRFIILEMIIALVWVCFWLFIIFQGEAFVMWVYDRL